MKSYSNERRLPDGYTAKEYLRETLETQWNLDTEYLGNEGDMRKAWDLQNEIRAANGIEPLDSGQLDMAVGHLLEAED